MEVKNLSDDFKSLFNKKKSFTIDEVVEGLFAFILRTAEKPEIKDESGNAILSEQKRAILLSYSFLMQFHLEDLDLGKIKVKLLYLLISKYQKVKNDNDMSLELLKLNKTFKELDIFFEKFKEKGTWSKDLIIFGRNPTPIELTLILSWFRIFSDIVNAGFSKIYSKIDIEDESKH